MGNLQIMTPSKYKDMPWKNGLGTTLEIQLCEDNNGLRFRISQASVIEDGLFSDFKGLQRTLILLSGNGLTLTNQHTNLSQNIHNILDSACFSGANKTFAKLKNGMIEDLNIMVRETDTRSRIQSVQTDQKIRLSDSDKLIFWAFYAQTACSLNTDINCRDEKPIDLTKGSLLFYHKLNVHEQQSISIKINALVTAGTGILIEIFSK